jgi:hypothetical protein
MFWSGTLFPFYSLGGTMQNCRNMNHVTCTVANFWMTLKQDVWTTDSSYPCYKLQMLTYWCIIPFQCLMAQLTQSHEENVGLKKKTSGNWSQVGGGGEHDPIITVQSGITWMNICLTTGLAVLLPMTWHFAIGHSGHLTIPRDVFLWGM